MLPAALLTLTLAALGAVDVNASDGVCTLNIWTDLNTPKEPLLLEVNETRDRRETLDLVFPTEVVKSGTKSQGVLYVSEGKKLLAACPGNKNYVEASRKQSDYIECSNGKLSINRKPANEDSLSCKTDAARSFVKETTESCGAGENEGTKFMIGFRLTDEKDEEFFPLIEVCHNTKKMVSYYSSHQLYGKSLEGAVKYSGRPKFSGEGSFDCVNPDWAYKQSTQHEAFDALLGKGAGKKYSVENKIFLARGHLAPDADFIYNSGQQATYYYINAAPQWQNFNAYNWLSIENAARKLASVEEATLNVWTGTYGTLKLPDNNGNEKEIYLSPKELKRPGRGRKGKKNQSDEADEDLIPVPEVYWKLVQHPTKKSCTVAVGHNNVFLETSPKPICDPVTVDGWPKTESLPLSRGYVYYCNYHSFKKTVDYIPEIDCTDLFPFPN